jgi:hypothetical protein
MAGKLALMTTQPTAALLGRCCVRHAGGPFFWVQPRLTPAGLEMRPGAALFDCCNGVKYLCGSRAL